MVAGQDWREGRMAQRHKETFQGVGMFSILIMAMVSPCIRMSKSFKLFNLNMRSLL